MEPEMSDTKLDKATIVSEALDLMREEGLERFSMRRLGARLGVTAPTLYWYFPDKSSILREILKALGSEAVDRVPPCASWQEWLYRFAGSLWQTNRESPFVMILLQSRELNDQDVFRSYTGRLEAALGRFAVPPEIWMRAHSDIQALVLGWSVWAQSGVTQRIGSMADTDTAVMEGVAAVIAHWERKISDGAA